MSKLLFHRVGLAEISPFDEAIISIAKGSHIKIVSPYIGLRYFQRLVALSSGWRLITDVEAWLSSLANQERILSTQFIQDNCERIHHFPAIHAKTVIGCATAYLGSANLTSAGIQTRTEMGVLVDESEMIADLHSWFDELWQATSIPVMAEVLAYSRGLDSESREKTPKIVLKSLSFDGEQVHARLMRLPNANADLITPQVVSQSPPIERNTQSDILEVSQVTEAPSQSEKKNLQALSAQSPMEGEFERQPEVEKNVLFSLAADYLSENLEDAVILLIDKLANSGFTFKEFVGGIRRGCNTFRTCAVYLELARYCGNLPRSVFSTDTINRLIYTNGLFRQSTRFEAAPSLAQHDMFLVMLIEVLSFGGTILVQDHLAACLSRRPVWVRRWLYDLKQVGLLIECIATTKNSLGSYQLNEEFKWTGRWRLFERACKTWDVKLKSYCCLASLPTAMIGDAERGGIVAVVEEGNEKSIIFSETELALNNGFGQSVYVRTHIEKRLPPIIATTVSSTHRFSTVIAKTANVSFNSRKSTPRQEVSFDIKFVRRRADNVYYALFEKLAKSEDQGVIGVVYSELLHQLSNSLGESTEFIHQVLYVKILFLPAAAKVITLKRKCSVIVLLDGVAAYPRTNKFVKKIMANGKLVYPWYEQSKPKVKILTRPMLSIKSSKNTALENRLIAHRMPEGDNAVSSQTQEVDEIEAYMQRVASIFKYPST